MMWSLYVLAVALSTSAAAASIAKGQHSPGTPVTLRPLIPLDNLTAYWSYYNTYLRRPISDIIDAIPFTIQAQQGSTIKDVTPKDIRKGISEALDMMPFSNRTAFELELRRLRTAAAAGNGTSPPEHTGWSQPGAPGASGTYAGPASVSNNIRNSEHEHPIEHDNNDAYSDSSGQPPASHRGRPSIYVGHDSGDIGTTNAAQIPSPPTETILMKGSDTNVSQTSPYGFTVLPGGYVKTTGQGVDPAKVPPLGEPHTASYNSYGFSPFPPPKHYHPHFHFPTKVSHKVVPVPFPVVRVQPVYYPIYKQVPVPKPYPVVHERHVPVPHYIPVPKPVPQPIYIPMPKPIPQPVAVPQPIAVPKPIPYPVPKPYPVPVPLPPKDKSVIQLGLRIERPQTPPLRQRVFQFLTPIVGGAISPAPPPSQAVPIPMPPMISGYPSYGQFGGPMIGKGGYPVDTTMGGFGGPGFAQGGFGGPGFAQGGFGGPGFAQGGFGGPGFAQGGYGGSGGFSPSFVPQMPGGGMAVPGMSDVPGAGGAVEVNRRSETDTEQGGNPRDGDARPEPFQANQMPQEGDQVEQAEPEPDQVPPRKSSLMRFILNVDS